MKNPHLSRRITAGAIGVLLLIGCGTRVPASQEARLTKASGVASISVVMPEGLWKDNKPWRDLDKVPVDHLDGEVNLTCTQMVATTAPWRQLLICVDNDYYEVTDLGSIDGLIDAVEEAPPKLRAWREEIARGQKAGTAGA